MDKGVYVAVKYTEVSLNMLSDMVLCKLDNPVSLDDIHTTIIYSTTGDVDKISFSGKEIIPIFACCQVNGYEIWKSDYYNSHILVAILDTATLTRIHKTLMNSYPELSYTFSEYIPHITISKKINSDFDVSQLPTGLVFFADEIYKEAIHDA